MGFDSDVVTRGRCPRQHRIRWKCASSPNSLRGTFSIGADGISESVTSSSSRRRTRSESTLPIRMPDDIVTLDLHHEVNRPVIVRVSSKDVIHSFNCR